MSQISIVAAIDEQLGLGKDNQLLCHLPADLKHFKELTLGKPIIMGRKTFESIGKALPGRLNIVLSRHPVLAENILTVNSLKEALMAANQAPEVMVIGGAQLFEEALPMARMLHLTTIHHTFQADVFFPVFSASDWDCIEETRHDADGRNAFSMTFNTFVKKVIDNRG